MSVFGFGKKNEAIKATGMENGMKNGMENKKGESIKVLGSGCAKCNELEANVKKALEQLGRDTAIEHVTDFGVIAAYGVMTTPALVVGEKVVSYGRVLKVEEAVKLLEQN